MAVREGGSEASVGEHIGQPLSLAKIYIPGADAVAKVEGNMDGRVSASAWTARRGRRTWHVWKLFVREPGDPTSDQSTATPSWSASGRRGAVADDVQTREVKLRHSS